MDADQHAGLAGIAMLLHDLLWWGGLAGVLVLVRLSLQGARAEPAPRAAVPVDALTRGAVPTALPPAPGGEGRLGGGPSRPAAPAASPVRALPTPDADRLLVVAGLTLAASGVHAVMVLGHAGSGWPVPLFFGVVTAVQAAQALRILGSPSSEVLVGVVVLDLALLLVWAASRTVGVLGQSEAVGPWDAAVVVWQVTCVVLGLRLLRHGPVQLRPPPCAPGTWGAGTRVVLALTVLTLLVLPGASHG